MYPTMALPLSVACHKSTFVPPMQVMGAEPKKPAKKRVMRTVSILPAVAVPRAINAEMPDGIRMGSFRP